MNDPIRKVLVLAAGALFAGCWLYAFYCWFRMLRGRARGATVGDLWLPQDEFLTDDGRHWRDRWFRWTLGGTAFGLAAALIAP